MRIEYIQRAVMGLVFIVLFAATAKAQTVALTQSEMASFRAQIAACWTLGGLSAQARSIKITVAFQMTRDGKPIRDTLRLTGAGAHPTQPQLDAYAAAKRAILRCGRNGYKLPLAKYGQWQSIELRFDPERT